MEILQPSLVSDDDARIFSDSLAIKSSNSKSANQMEEESEIRAVNKAKQDEIDMKKLEEIQAQNKRL